MLHSMALNVLLICAQQEAMAASDNRFKVENICVYKLFCDGCMGHAGTGNLDEVQVYTKVGKLFLCDVCKEPKSFSKVHSPMCMICNPLKKAKRPREPSPEVTQSQDSFEAEAIDLTSSM